MLRGIGSHPHQRGARTGQIIRLRAVYRSSRAAEYRRHLALNAGTARRRVRQAAPFRRRPARRRPQDLRGRFAGPRLPDLPDRRPDTFRGADSPLNSPQQPESRAERRPRGSTDNQIDSDAPVHAGPGHRRAPVPALQAITSGEVARLGDQPRATGPAAIPRRILPLACDPRHRLILRTNACLFDTNRGSY